MANHDARPASERTTVRRLAQRGIYDRAAIDAILDEGLVCHVGFNGDGQPFVIPTLYVRAGDRILIHGAMGSRMLRALRAGAQLCVTVTIVDGLVLARSVFHHSVNYRSVVILGTATEVVERAEKLAAMRALVEHVIPRRWNDVRPPSEEELRATAILAIPLDEASAKVRTGQPIDDEADYALGVWAGVVPLSLDAHAPIPDPRLEAGIAVPGYARFYRRAPLVISPEQAASAGK
jgi:nitroimidazol reductase NimA-like FMN-containing flavoprotein (pyridoxamine 5'-phosphate oxidase superfamily)